MNIRKCVFSNQFLFTVMNGLFVCKIMQRLRGFLQAGTAIGALYDPCFSNSIKSRRMVNGDVWKYSLNV